MIHHDFYPIETKEAAFVYALTCATVVSTVAQWCAKNDGKVTYCGCDKTLEDEKLGCSPDVEFGIQFSKQLINAGIDNATLHHKTFILHNCEVGQLVSSLVQTRDG